jgi:hypothetical protein
LPVRTAGDHASIKGVIEKSAFDEDGGDFGFANDVKAGAFDPAVGQGTVAEQRGVDGRGEEDIFRIAFVAGEFANGVDSEVFLAHRRNAAGSEGKSFDAGASGSFAFVEVDADEDGVLLFVGEGGAFFEGDEVVAFAREEDAVAAGFEESFGADGDIKSIFLFGAESADSARIVPAMAGVENHSADLGGIGDFSGTEDGLDDFRHVHGREEGATVPLHDGKAEDVFDPVDFDLFLPGFALEGASTAGEIESSSSGRALIQSIKTSHVFNGNMATTIILHHIPTRPGLVGQERNCQQKQNERTHQDGAG